MSDSQGQSASGRIGALAQDLMEQVEREHPGSTLDQLVILAVLSESDGGGQESMQVQIVSETPDPLSLVGLLTVALELAKGQLTEG